MKKQNKQKLPEFESESEERAFWQEADSADYIDWDRAERASFPSLKPSLKSISIRLPEGMIEQLKVLANRRDVPYQSLMKMYLSEKLREELNA
jgi:predicted DNA binding CopG/RHH family protein